MRSAWPIFATSTTAVPRGVVNISLSPSGEKALSWKYSVDPPASSVSRTTRWPVAGSTQSRGGGDCSASSVAAAARTTTARWILFITARRRFRAAAPGLEARPPESSLRRTMIAEGALVFGVHDLELADIEEQSSAPEDSSGFNRGGASTGPRDRSCARFYISGKAPE